MRRKIKIFGSQILSMADKSKVGITYPGLWTSILEEFQIPLRHEIGHVLVLGGLQTGKSTLISEIFKRSLKGSTTDKVLISSDTSHIGIGHRLCPVKEDEELIGFLSIWEMTVDKRDGWKRLFQTALNQTRDPLIIITLDFSFPGLVLQQLLSILESIDSLDVLDDESAERKSKLHNFIQSIQGVSSTSTLAAIEYSKSQTTISGEEGGNEKQQNLIPLREGVLVKNLGFNLLIVGTKSDQIAKLNSNMQISEAQWDFLQQLLRLICMKYGASLAYCSPNESKSLDKVYEFMKYRLFHPNSTMNIEADILSHENLFIPCGWDSFGKISSLTENAFDCKYFHELSDVELISLVQGKIPENTGRGREEGEVYIGSEDEQTFLEKQSKLLNNNNNTSAGVNDGSSGLAADFIASNQSNVSAAKRTSDAKERPIAKTIELTTSNNSTSSTTASTTKDNQSEVLASFFQNLLSRKPASNDPSSSPTKKP